jgi:hypothetical protein
VAHEASCPLGTFVPCLNCGGIEDHDPCCERQLDRSDIAALIAVGLVLPLTVLLVYLARWFI